MRSKTLPANQTKQWTAGTGDILSLEMLDKVMIPFDGVKRRKHPGCNIMSPACHA